MLRAHLSVLANNFVSCTSLSSPAAKNTSYYFYQYDFFEGVGEQAIFFFRGRGTEWVINPLRDNDDLSQISHCNIQGLSVREVMRIENMITQVQFY